MRLPPGICAKIQQVAQSRVIPLGALQRLFRQPDSKGQLGMARLPQKYAPFVFGVIQAAITTAVATAIATRQLTEFGLLFLQQWTFAWLVAWLTMLPVVILFAPLLQRAVAALTVSQGSHPSPAE